MYKYVNEWIVNVTDISEYVKELNILRKKNVDISDRLPKEELYKISNI